MFELWCYWIHIIFYKYPLLMEDISFSMNSDCSRMCNINFVGVNNWIQLFAFEPLISQYILLLLLIRYFCTSMKESLYRLLSYELVLCISNNFLTKKSSHRCLESKLRRKMRARPPFHPGQDRFSWTLQRKLSRLVAFLKAPNRGIVEFTGAWHVYWSGAGGLVKCR